MTATHLSPHVEAPVRAVIFDMDGLLLDSETLAMDSLVSAGQALGYDIPYSFCRRMIGIPADVCREMVFSTYGRDFPLQQFFEVHEVHLRELVDSGKLGLKAGVIELLDYLDRHRIPRAIATSSSRVRTDHHLALVGLLQRFDHIVTRDDVSRGKPDPEPYLTAAAKLGVTPADCLALEDSYNGVRAAHAAAIRVIMVPDLLEPIEEMHEKALHIVDDLHRVIAFLDEHIEA
ncbi:HAD family hydrolase [Frateuria aurantia]|uniref:Haloacid dehalogenase superfamily protein, subfamily IA, variant 3 with third motif having DD or ED n=1 Tax=Frateuria aurantia (strain ATCC 33424 / DSM 6220 / KCTC 2777 / LMG 1558 / NBRC 3245 / NCIMB 13370) TaxID=767434 RepID=H8KYZ3_FRAAD|nr:HAD family phosphatase [Frateuria aurantia]AFC87023.1 haloacid dehalogenase superfamily protein, subfamily IA, variant 3 with third motif having DD or ED [Frateuria aurantia DSM 6220]